MTQRSKDKHESPDNAVPEIQKHAERMAKQQLAAVSALGRRNQSLLIVLQALDAGGKDGVVRHLFNAMNPQGTWIVSFKQLSTGNLRMTSLWRVHMRAAAKGEVVIFNRSHYEDVLVVRVHRLMPRTVWLKRYELINDFEQMLVEHGTRILKCYLHISPAGQLECFKQRLDDPSRHWKFAKATILSAELWPEYVKAFEDAMENDQHQTRPMVCNPVQPQMVP